MKRQTKASFAPTRGTNEHLLAQSRDLAALLSVAEVATQSLDVNAVLNDTLTKSLQLLQFEVGFIRTFDADGNMMVVRAAHGLRTPEFLSSVTPIDSERRNVTRIVYETKEPYVCSDIRKNPVYKNRAMEREGVISTAAAPVLSKNRVLGIIVVGSRTYHRFSKREVRLLTAFGAQLGAALENASLYDEVAKGKTYIENLVENAADAIFSTDNNDLILTWNRGAEVLFGYSKEEAIGKNLTTLLPPDRLHALEDIRAKVRISGALRNMEARGRRKNGALIYLALSVSPILDSDGKIVALLRVAKDVTEKKHLEIRLKQLDKMKSDFVSNVSHELRTPLTAIKGSVDNMLDGLTGTLNEKQQRYLYRMKTNTDRLSRLINDILDLSKIEAGRIELRSANIVPYRLIHEVVEQLRPVANEKLVSIETPIREQDLAAWADPDKVTQVLINLLGNAIKFTPAKGTISVAASPLDEEWISISVTDSGPGIEKEEANKIFDKFYQIAVGKNQKTKGSGLGLAISRALVEMHGGRIWVENGADAGCVFAFTLPRNRPFKFEKPVHRETGNATESPGR